MSERSVKLKKFKDLQNRIENNIDLIAKVYKLMTTDIVNETDEFGTLLKTLTVDEIIDCLNKEKADA